MNNTGFMAMDDESAVHAQVLEVNKKGRMAADLPART